MAGRQGLASMSQAKRRAIARKGGQAAHRKGTAHEWTPDEARAAARKAHHPVAAEEEGAATADLNFTAPPEEKP
jgi:hypothetical protein